MLQEQSFARAPTGPGRTVVKKVVRIGYIYTLAPQWIGPLSLPIHVAPPSSAASFILSWGVSKPLPILRFSSPTTGVITFEFFGSETTDKSFPLSAIGDVFVPVAVRRRDFGFLKFEFTFVAVDLYVAY